jgi:hypothetical protein
MMLELVPVNDVTRRWLSRLPIAAVLSGCTSLGPMPATTAMSSIPANRASDEGQVGFTPGFYLSEAVKPDPGGRAPGQAALLFEPDHLIGLPGLVVGGRYVGDSDALAYPEPLLGYRTYLDDNRRFAVSAIGYVTRATGSRNGAAYAATRGGGEAGFDFRVTPANEWFELHLAGGASLTGISASGRYCIDRQQRFAVDCPEGPDEPVERMDGIDVKAGGLYPAGVATVAFDVGRRLRGVFHGGRLALTVGGGTMPRVVSGQQVNAYPFSSAGLTLTIGFGESRGEPRTDSP